MTVNCLGDTCSNVPSTVPVTCVLWCHFQQRPLSLSEVPLLLHNKLFCHPFNNTVIFWNISAKDIHIQTLENRTRMCLECLSPLVQQGPRHKTLKTLRKSYLHFIRTPATRPRIAFFLLHSYQLKERPSCKSTSFLKLSLTLL